MAIFCTKCGTSKEDVAGFCDNCGTKLRSPLPAGAGGDLTTPLPASIPSVPTLSKTASINPKTFAYAGAVLVTVLMLGGGSMYFILQPPAATASTLLAAAKVGYGRETTDRFKRELCISNIDYSKSTFNAGENDQRTQAWMDALVTAGLYAPPVAISSGGFFAQTLRQYVATPELEKFRQNTRLCAAKDVEFSEVTDIQKPEEEFLGRNGGPPKVLMVKSKLLLKSLNTASWMEKPEVRDAFMTSINDWEYKDKTLQKQIAESFGLKDNKWTTGIAYKDELQKQRKNAQRNTNNDDKAEGHPASKSGTGGFGSTLSNLFAFGNPLKGTWRSAATHGGFGGNLPADILPRLTFTSDSMETSGQSTSVDFSVDGNRIKVTPKGQSQSLVFVMEGPDIMVAQAFDNMRYERASQ